MAERQEHKKRYNLRLQYIAEFNKWLNDEPCRMFFRKWHKWKNSRPVWQCGMKEVFAWTQVKEEE